MGGGKTLTASLLAKEYLKKNPTFKVFANYYLNVPNFVYTPYMFLPLSKLENCLIICDDIASIPNLKGLIQIMVNASRKKDLILLFTGQYYTQLPKQTRSLSIPIIPFIFSYDNTSELFVFKGICEGDDSEYESNDELKYEVYHVKEVFEKAKGLYNTNEVVQFSDDSIVLREIEKISENEEDIRLNVNLYTQSRTLRKKFLEYFGIKQ